MGRCPWPVAVESGQCDLLLISYLGIDFENKGERVYRLLDCTLTFLDELPKEGQTLRYDISINSFASSGENAALLLQLRLLCRRAHGAARCAAAAPASSPTRSWSGGRGVVDSRDDIEQRRRAVRQIFAPPLRTFRRSLSDIDLDLLIAGQICQLLRPGLRPARAQPLAAPARPPDAYAHRVTSIDPRGGDWGLGLVIGEQDLTPESWFFPCHFQDDQVMAGSLMAEGCSQLLQIYMLALGLQAYTFGRPLPAGAGRGPGGALPRPGHADHRRADLPAGGDETWAWSRSPTPTPTST